MIATETPTSYTCPFSANQNYWRSLGYVETQPARNPGFVTFLSQGATAGMIVYFSYLVIGILSVDTYYAILFPKALPEFLAWGLCIGTFLGLLNWIFNSLVGRRNGLILRLTFSVLGYLFVMRAIAYWFPHEDRPVGWTIVPHILLPSVIMGSLIGSRLKPLAELSRGTSFSKAPGEVYARISGVFLRLAVLFLLMESSLILIVAVRWEAHQRELVFMLLGFGHFLLAALLVFARFKFVPLSLLAIIINAPVVSFFFDFQNQDSWISKYLAPAYIILWVVFLLSRSHLVQNAIRIFNEEVRYYLID